MGEKTSGEGKKDKKPKPYKVGCGKYLQRFDEAIMKPIFIYKYHHLRAKDAEDFFNIMIEEGNTLEAMYKHQKTGGMLDIKKDVIK